MLNKISGCSLLALLILISFVGCDFKPTGPTPHFVISSDGYPEPGQRQDFLVYQFDEKGNIASNPMAITVKLEAQTQNHKFTGLGENQGRDNNLQPHHCSFLLPDELTHSSLYLNIYSQGLDRTLLFSKKIPLLKNIRLAVMPRKSPVYCGEWLNLKIAVFNPRNLAGIYKVPVRVKMTTPFGLTTINRILTTELDGFVNFTTFINSNSPPGNYLFEISCQNSLVRISLPIRDAASRISRISNQLPALGLGKLSPARKDSDEEKFSLTFPVENSIIQTLKPGNQQIKFDFDCADSTFRSAEVWQNGMLLNYSELPIETGNSSHPLPRNFRPEIPLRLKVWFLQNQKLMMHERSVFMKYPQENAVIDFINEYQNLSETEDNIVQKFLKSDSILSADTTPWHPPVYQVFMDSLQANHEEMVATKVSDSRRLLETRKKLSFPGNRFFIVTDEFDLSKFNFDRLKIHLDTKQFYRHFIASLYQPVADIETIISETEARLLRFELLSPPEQEAELEKLEGLIIPITEFLSAKIPVSQEISRLKNRCKGLLQEIGNLMFVPPEIIADLPDSDSYSPSLSAIQPFLEKPLSRESINRIVKNGGKIRIKTESHEFPVNLNAKIVDFKNRVGKRRTLEKLVNLRIDPVLIELIFKDSGSGK